MKIKALIVLSVLTLMVKVPVYAESKDIVFFGKEAVVEKGETVDNVFVFGSRAEISGTVTDSVVSLGGPVIIKSSGKVQGDIVCMGGEIRQEDGSSVSGTIIDLSAIPMPSSDWIKGLVGMMWVVKILVFLGTIALLFLITGFFPDTLDKVSLAVKKQLGRSLFWGMIIFIGTVPVTVLLAVSLIGVIVIPFLFLALACAGLLGYTAICKLSGQKILKAFRARKSYPVWDVLTGFIILSLIGIIPILGGLVSGLFLLTGSGAVAVILLNFRKKISPAKKKKK